jgi:hypothetical protein
MTALRTTADGDTARAWIWTAALALAAGVLYAVTLCPTVSWYDSAEFSASAASLRVVPHPPGYPLYAIMGHVFTWLPGEAAWGMNVMSAAFGVAAVALMHRVALRLSVSRPAALVPPVLLAVAPSVWGNAVVAEVYTPGLVFMLSAVLLCLKARAGQEPRFAWGAAAIAGAGLGVHMSVATWGVGFVALVGAAAWPTLRAQPRATLLRWGGGCAVATLLGAAVLLLVPFGPFDAVTPLGPYEDSFGRIWARFIADVQGGVFRRYFKSMPLLGRSTWISGILRRNLGWAGLIAAGVGFGWALLRERVLAVAFALGALGNLVFFFNYDVPDLDVFLLPCVVSLAVFAGWGVEAAYRFRAALGWAWAAVLAVAAVVAAAGNFDTLDRSQDRSARLYGDEACAVLPPGAVLTMTSRPDEWRLYSVVLYMHEAEEGCADVEFWGVASVEMIQDALDAGRPVYAFVPAPRFGWAFQIQHEAPLYRVNPS